MIQEGKKRKNDSSLFTINHMTKDEGMVYLK